MIERFWNWYNKHILLHTGIAAGLFLIQIVHLIWLFGEVLWTKMTGVPLFTVTGFWQNVLIYIDYTEIPAIITTSLIYIHQLRKKRTLRPWLFLLLINSQWLHLLWITDEFVISSFTKAPGGMLLPVWLAIVAIVIDFLEIPVIVDTIKKFTQALRERRMKEVLEKNIK
jgi:hypothetical protein